jgi:tetratricopeptide (TPR) repeat protein
VFPRIRTWLKLRSVKKKAGEKSKSRASWKVSLKLLRDLGVVVGLLAAIVPLVTFSLNTFGDWRARQKRTTLGESYAKIAQDYYDRTRYGKAIKFFNLALENKPNDPNLLMNLLRARADSIFESAVFQPFFSIRAGIEKIEENCKLLANIVDDEKHISEISRIEGLIAWSKFDSKRARAKFEESLARWHKNYQALASYGRFLNIWGHPDAGITKFQQADSIAKTLDNSEKDKARALVHTNWGLMFLDMHLGLNEVYYDSAKFHLTIACELDSLNPVYNASLGFVLILLGKSDSARFYFDRADFTDPAESFTNFSNGMANLLLGNYKKAAVQFKKAYNKDKSDPTILSKLGRTQLHLHQYAIGYENLNRALELDEDNVVVLHDYALGLASIGKYDEAIRKYDRIIELIDREPIFYQHYADLYFRTWDLAQGKLFMERALARDSTRADVYFTWAARLDALGQYQEADGLFALAY